jgi:hypothetical protein
MKNISIYKQKIYSSYEHAALDLDESYMYTYILYAFIY